MEERRRRRHQAQKRALVVCRSYRPFFAGATDGRSVLAELKRAVAAQAARYASHERCRIEQKAAADRGRKARCMLYGGLRYVAYVSRRVKYDDGSERPFEPPSWMSDGALLARAETILSEASPHEERFTGRGLLPGFLAVLAGEAAALKKAKNDVMRARVRLIAAREAFDRELRKGDALIAVLEGTLVTASDAPDGALASLRLAKRIGRSGRAFPRASVA